MKGRRKEGEGKVSDYSAALRKSCLDLCPTQEKTAYLQAATIGHKWPNSSSSAMLSTDQEQPSQESMEITHRRSEGAATGGCQTSTSSEQILVKYPNGAFP